MTPERFCTEVPQRMRRLLDAMYPVAHEQGLTTSFTLMVAMPLLMIPLERTATRGRTPANAISDVNTARSFVQALQGLKQSLFWVEFLQNPELLRKWRSPRSSETLIAHRNGGTLWVATPCNPVLATTSKSKPLKTCC
jgi:hypothetical protein